MAMQREPEWGVLPGQDSLRLSVIVRIPTPLRKLTNDQDVVSSNGETLTQCIDDLDAQYPGLKDRLLDETGELRRFVNIYINGEDVRFAQGVQTALKPGDEISIVPAVAGGSEERLYMLHAWRESHLYSERERAALAWTEELTLVAETGADEVYEEAR